jgi:hypothetical protein
MYFRGRIRDASAYKDYFELNRGRGGSSPVASFVLAIYLKIRIRVINGAHLARPIIENADVRAERTW